VVLNLLNIITPEKTGEFQLPVFKKITTYGLQSIYKKTQKLPIKCFRDVSKKAENTGISLLT